MLVVLVLRYEPSPSHKSGAGDYGLHVEFRQVDCNIVDVVQQTARAFRYIALCTWDKVAIMYQG